MGEYLMKLLTASLVALCLATASSSAATYTLEITNKTGRSIFKVWVDPGEIGGGACGRTPVCSRPVMVPDGVCRSNVTINMANAGRANNSVYWCSGESVIEVELR